MVAQFAVDRAWRSQRQGHEFESRSAHKSPEYSGLLVFKDVPGDYF